MGDQQHKRSSDPQQGMVTGVHNEGGNITFNYDKSVVLVQGVPDAVNRETCPTQDSKKIANQGPSPQAGSPSPVMLVGASAVKAIDYAATRSVQGPPQETNMATALASRGGIIIQHIHGVDPPICRNQKDTVEEYRIERILTTVHQNTWEKSHNKIGETFKADKFSEAVPEVEPQMVASPLFYQGGHTKEEDVNISAVRVFKKKPRNHKPRRKRVDVRNPQYRKDAMFTFQDYSKSTLRFISTESVMSKINEKDDKLGTFGVVAQAGAGKTTCMRKWARNTMKMSGMTKENGYTPSKGSRFQFVHYIEMKSIENLEATTLRDLLFGDIFEDEKDIKIAYEWLLQHQDKSIVFFDGLDQARWAITKDDDKPVGRYKTASTANVFANLLKRSLLPGVRIVISSREHSATALPDEAWFEDVITLTGFSESDAKKLFNAITVDDDAFQLSRQSAEYATAVDDDPSNWDNLIKSSSSLLPFLSIPVILMFTAIVFKDGTAPNSVTDLMSKLIGVLQYSLNIKERGSIRMIIHKLKRLSHEGMKKELVIFSEDDLKSCGLALKDISDILLMVTRKRSLSHRLIEGDSLFFFCHQIFQEFLSACAIVEMNLAEFKEFVTTELHEDRWSVVRRFVCGLVFAKSLNDDLLRIADRDEKQRILREFLATQLKLARENQLLEVYAAIYETDDAELIDSISEISLLFLGREAAHMIGSMLTKINHLNLLSLLRSNSTDDMLNIMADHLKVGNSKPMIKEINVTSMANSGFTFTGLNNFLQNVRTEEICIGHGAISFEQGGPIWDKIRRLRVKDNLSNRQIVLVNKLTSDLLQLYVENGFDKSVEGHFGVFNKTDNELSIVADSPDYYFAMYRTDMVTKYLKPNSVSFDAKDAFSTQYVSHNQLDAILRWKPKTQVDEVILDYLKPYHPDDRDDTADHLMHCEVAISSLVRNFRMRIVDLAIDSSNIGNIPVLLRHGLYHLDCELRVHLTAMILSADSLRTLLVDVKSHQTYSPEYLRLLIEYQVSIDELVSFMKRVNVTKQVWLYYSCGRATISESDQQTLQKVAASLGVIVKVERWERSHGEDPWSRIWFRPSTHMRVDHRP